MLASSIISVPDQIVIKELNIDNEMAILENEDIDISRFVSAHGNNRSVSLWTYLTNNNREFIRQ